MTTSDEIYRRYVVARGDPVADQLRDLLGPHGTPDSVELDRLVAEGRTFNTELRLDAKRPPVEEGRSTGTPGAATPERSPGQGVSAMVAGGPGVLHTNKETPG